MPNIYTVYSMYMITYLCRCTSVRARGTSWWWTSRGIPSPGSRSQPTRDQLYHGVFLLTISRIWNRISRIFKKFICSIFHKTKKNLVRQSNLTIDRTWIYKLLFSPSRTWSGTARSSTWRSGRTATLPQTTDQWYSTGVAFGSNKRPLGPVKM